MSDNVTNTYISCYLQAMYIRYVDTSRPPTKTVVLTRLASLFSVYPKGHRPMRKNTCSIILYTLSLKNKLHTCIIPCNTTLVWHVDYISTKYTRT